MKKLINIHRPSIVTVLCGSLLLLGCINSDYDFDKVDYTLGFGGDSINLPSNNSTKEIPLDDILDIGNSDLVSTDANGDYKLSKKPDNAINPINVKVDPITIAQDSHKGLSFSINLNQYIDPAILAIIGGTKIPLPTTITVPMVGSKTIDVPEVSGNISLLKYEFNAPQEIKSLEYVELGPNGQGVNLSLKLNIPTVISKLGYITIDLPDMLTMTCTSMPSQFDSSSNTLILTDWSNSGEMTINFNVTRINVKTISDDNYVKLEDGKFKINTTVSVNLKISEITVPSDPTLTVSGEASFNNLVVTGARGIFDPTINLSDVGTVQINSLPSFLTEEEVVADIDNPQIWLTLTSTMPLGGVINAQMTSDTHTVPIVLDPIQVAASADGTTPAVTKIVICRHEPAETYGYTPLIVNNLSYLIMKLREGMKIKFTVNSAKANQETATVKLGHNYSLAPEYKFECPLAFGDKAVIVYSHTENDWNKDINKINLSDDGCVHLTAVAVNKVPADLELEITPIDVNKQDISATTTIELIKKDVAGVKEGAKESTIEAKISGDISQLDGVIMKLKAKSNAELRGVTLNKNTQTLQLKDLAIKLVGKIIYDAN